MDTMQKKQRNCFNRKKIIIKVVKKKKKSSLMTRKDW